MSKGLERAEIIAVALLAVITSSALAFSFTQGNSNLNVAYELVVTDETGTGVVYTPECLTECHLVVKFKYDGAAAPLSFDIDAGSGSNFTWVFNKLSTSDDITVSDLRVLQTEVLNVSVSKTVCMPFNFTNENATISTEPNCTTTLAAEQQQRNSWKSVFGSPFRIEKGSLYYIDIVGKRSASVNKRFTDVVPTIYGFALSELAWWNDSWSGADRYHINNTLNMELTDFQIPITVNTASKISAGNMQSDCGDVRFTDASNVTSFNYTVIEGCNSASTKFLVKVGVIKPDQNTTIFMYYKNPSAANGDNSAGTYDFF